MVKNLPANAGDMGSIPCLGRYPGRAWQPILAFLPDESHGQRSLVGIVHEVAELDTTGHMLHAHTFDLEQGLMT